MRSKLIWTGHKFSRSSDFKWMLFHATMASFLIHVPLRDPSLGPWQFHLLGKSFFLKDSCWNVYQSGVSYLLYLITYEHITAYCQKGWVGWSGELTHLSHSRRQLVSPGCSRGDKRRSRHSGTSPSKGRLGCSLQQVGRREISHSYL